MSGPARDAPRRGRGYDVVRWAVALLLALYGFSKITGAQFRALDSEMDKPMREVSGFWLTWYYFGYSAAYRTLLGLAEVGAALLLSARRSALLGACVAFVVLSNVVLIDAFYGVDAGGMVMAVAMWIGAASLLSAHGDDLRRVLWPPALGGARSGARQAAAWTARLALLVALPAAGNWWIAHHTTRVPTPLDGTWRLAAAAPGAPTRVYFERERAYMVVFRLVGNRWETHHFEVDPAAARLRVWDRWLAKGDPVLDAGYAFHGDTLQLDGRWSATGAPLRWHLVRLR